jgi:hypothetical protein
MIVETMFLVANQCIFIQTRGYWLLSNDLNVALLFKVCLQNQIEQYEITPFNFVKGDFESKSGALQVHMMVEVQIILAPFLAFTSFYNVSKVNN